MIGGSLTVECAIVLPLFMFFILSVIYMTGLFRSESIVGSGMLQNAEFAARDAYVGETLGGGGLANGLESLLSIVSVKSAIMEKAGENYINKCGIDKGAAGIVCMSDAISNKDRIIITSLYKYHVPFNIFGLHDFVVRERVESRKWTGYDILEDTKDEEEIVYVAKNGTVYHKTPNCTHINLDIRAVSGADLGSYRNDDGCRYYGCERCMRGNNKPSVVYITPWGTCAHSSRNCSGLKRSVKAVPLSKVGGLGPCSRCSKG